MAKVDMDFSSLDVDELERVIKSSASSKGAVAQDARDNFCEIWPKAKTALEILLPIILSAMPGASIFVKMAFKVILEAGDAASRVICSKR